MIVMNALTHVVKIGLIFILFGWQIAADVATESIGSIFEYSVSLGIMAIILYVMIREYRDVRTSLDEVNGQYAQLLKESTKVLTTTNETLEAVKKSLDRYDDHITRTQEMTLEISKLATKIDKQNQSK